MPEPVARLERFLDLGVGVEDPLPAEELHRVEEMAAGSDGRVDLEPVLHAGREVVAAVARGGVHRAGALLERDVVGQHAERIAGVQRMAEPDLLELDPFHARNRRAERAPGHFGDLRGQRFGDDHGAAVHVVRGVVELGMEGDRQVRRDRPRRRRPDEDRHVAAGERRHARGQFLDAALSQRELDVDRRRRVIRVFDLRLRQRRAAVDAPVDRFLALVDEATLHESARAPARSPPGSGSPS